MCSFFYNSLLKINFIKFMCAFTYCVYSWVCAHDDVPIEVKEQFADTGSPLLPNGTQGLNSIGDPYYLATRTFT